MTVEFWLDEDLRHTWFRHICVEGFPSTTMLDSRWSATCSPLLTVTPSVHCVKEKGGCGLHGWIRNGFWVPV